MLHVPRTIGYAPGYGSVVLANMASQKASIDGLDSLSRNHS